MDTQVYARYDALAKVIKAIAHPSRLFVIDELAKGERCVCELTEMIGADTSTVSKHLAILKSAGIIQSEKRGVQVYYKLHIPCILKFLGCIESVITTQAQESLSCIK